MMQQEKIRPEDVKVGKGKIEVDCFIVKGVPKEIHRYDRADNYTTHDDCIVCGNEFKKRIWFQKTCTDCHNQDLRKKWESFPIVPWDGEAMLFLYGDDDKYFRDAEEIEEYCQDNECQLDDLMLVLCKPSTFSHIRMEHITSDAENVYEDWEPSAEMEEKIKEFNTWLDTQSTHTWFPTDQRVILKK